MEQPIFEDYHKMKLSKKEVEQLFIEYGKTKDVKIKEKIIAANLGLIPKTISVYFHSAPSYLYDDMISEGLRALDNSVERFRVDQGIAFSSYAVVAIQRKIARFLIEEDKYKDVVSLDMPVKNEEGFEETPLVNFILDDGEDMQDEIVRKIEVQEKMKDVYAFLGRLEPRDREIFERNWGLGRKKETRREIAKAVGLSSSRVDQIVNALLRRLKTHILFKGHISKEEKKCLKKVVPHAGLKEEIEEKEKI